MHQLIVISGGINFLTALLLSVVVFIKKRPLKQALYVNLAISFWSFFYFYWLQSTNLQVASLLFHFVFLGMNLIPYFFLQFCYETAGESPPKYLHLPNMLFMASIWSLSLVSPLVIKELGPIGDFQFWPKAGPLFIVYLGYFATNVILGHMLLYKKLKRNSKMWYIFIAFLLGFGGATTNFFYFYDVHIPPIGNIGASVYTAIVTYAIIRHKLLDISFAVSSGIARGVTYILFLISYFSLTGILKLLGVEPLVLGVFSGLFFVSTYELYPWVREKIQEIPDKILVKRHFNFEDVSWSMGQSLGRCIRLPEILEIMSGIIETDMKLEIKEVYVPKEFEFNQDLSADLTEWDIKKHEEKDSIFEKNTIQTTLASLNKGISPNKDALFSYILTQNSVTTLEQSEPAWLHTLFKQIGAGAIIPFLIQDQACGFVVIGERHDEPRYTYDDLKMFELIAVQVGTNIDRLRAYGKALSGITQLQKSASLLRMINFFTHDIKAPLTTLRYIIDELPQLGMSLKKGMEDQIKRVMDLVKTMLDIAKENRERDPKPILISEVLHDVFKFYRCPIQVSGNWNEEIARPYVNGVHNDLLVLFTNLVKNAAEALSEQIDPNPKITIDISIEKNQFSELGPNPISVPESQSRRSKNEGGQEDCIALSQVEDPKEAPAVVELGSPLIKVRIVDNGPGIPPEKIPTLFEFTATTKVDGSGVGLQAIASIAKEHDGKIEVESELKKGSVFTVTLPIADKAYDIYEKPVEYVAPDIEELLKSDFSDCDSGPRISEVPRSDKNPEGPLKILLLEDDPGIQALLKRKLETKHAVLTASNGREGLTHLEENPDIACILTDMSMPVMDGRRFMASTARQENIPPILICSSEDKTQLEQEFNSHPHYAGVIDKFVTMKTFLETIAEVIQNHGPKKGA